MAISKTPTEVELVDARQVLQLHAIAQLRRLLPLYEATHDPQLLDEIQRWTAMLPEEDGIPMENFWHYLQIGLLIELVNQLWHDRRDYFAAGNVFVYYSPDQAEDVVLNRSTAYRGPDFFVVTGIDGEKPRDNWVVWLEGKYPDLIIELLSDTTADNDKNTKKDIYQNIFRTREYFWYDGDTEFAGWELVDGKYQPKTPNERGWFWSEVLGAWLGIHRSVYERRAFNWLRLFDREGRLVPTQEEAKRQAQRQAEQERLKREQVEAELERLKARLRELGVEE